VLGGVTERLMVTVLKSVISCAKESFHVQNSTSVSMAETLFGT